MSKTRTIGITGANGFIAEHLRVQLGAAGFHIKTAGRSEFADPRQLQAFVTGCDAIVHLAGVNRAEESKIFDANVAITQTLIDALISSRSTPHVLFSSSTQRAAENPYGLAKQECERRLEAWGRDCGAAVTSLIIPNVYGPGCRPFYNSVVATFCHQLARGESVQITTDRKVSFVWVNDLVKLVLKELRRRFESGGQLSNSCIRMEQVPPTAELTVSELLSLLQEFRTAFFQTGIVPCLREPLRASLYATFLYYVSLDQHQHVPQVHSDDRGHLFEVIKIRDGGQVFFSSTRPGVIRGNHYHTRKVEWFCVLKGEALIRIRRIGTSQVHEFRVNGNHPRFISIPVMHSHSLQNIGNEELLTMFWCNEIFDPQDADTIYEQVA